MIDRLLLNVVIVIIDVEYLTNSEPPILCIITFLLEGNTEYMQYNNYNSNNNVRLDREAHLRANHVIVPHGTYIP